jgi:hypothetical protein
VRKIPNDTFDSDQKASRVFSTVTPNLRFILCDDITKNEKKSSFLKKVCDGEVIVPKLYTPGDVKIDINAKLFISTNHILSFDTNDFGIQRRLKYYEYKTKFEEMDELVDEANGHFKKVKRDYKFLTTKEKLLFFNTVVRYASLFYLNCPILKPEVVQDCTTIPTWEMLANKVLYPDAHGKVVRSQLFKLAVMFFQPLQITEKQMQTELQKLNILYDKNAQHKGVRGCFTGVFLKPEFESL